MTLPQDYEANEEWYNDTQNAEEHELFEQIESEDEDFVIASPRAKLLLRLEQSLEMAKLAWRSSHAAEKDPEACDGISWSRALEHIQDSLEDAKTMMTIEAIKEEAPDDASADHEVWSDYRPGGYHPVRLGEVFRDRYVVTKKLGWGHFSTVWLAEDKTADATAQNKFVALKVVKSAPVYAEAAVDEIDLLATVTNKATELGETPPVVTLLDHFVHEGPHGEHVCLVFEVCGKNLLHLIQQYNYKGLPLEMVKSVTREICEGLNFMHTKCEIIHTDLKPENVLMTAVRQSVKGNQVAEDHTEESTYVTSAQDTTESKKKKRKSKKQRERERRKTEAQAAQTGAGKEEEVGNPPETEVVEESCRAVVADLGNACWTFKHFTDEITTREYRAPEVILKCGYDCPVDMWSLGCMVFELLTGDLLFDPKEGRGFPQDADHLCQMLELLCIDKFPDACTASSDCPELLNEDGSIIHFLPEQLKFWGLKDVLCDKYNFEPQMAEEVSAFLMPLLELDPSKRATAEQCLQHPFVC
jgi:serine/threonine-protein kinase SRPK3